MSVLDQQPPQLFPQLPPSDEQPPLSAATPQRENWSRHRSAEHTHRGVQITRFSTPTHKNNIYRVVNPPLSSSSCAHTVLTHTSLLMTYTRRKLNEKHRQRSKVRLKYYELPLKGLVHPPPPLHVCHIKGSVFITYVAKACYIVFICTIELIKNRSCCTGTYLKTR